MILSILLIGAITAKSRPSIAEDAAAVQRRRVRIVIDVTDQVGLGAGVGREVWLKLPQQRVLLVLLPMKLARDRNENVKRKREDVSTQT